jgi:hypothetical protein
MKKAKSVITTASLKGIIECATLQNWSDTKVFIMMSIGFTPEEMAITVKEMPLLAKLTASKLLHPVFLYALAQTKTEDQLKIQKQAFIQYLNSNQ